jgi:CopG family nickel-responsive transcriptional regulator
MSDGLERFSVSVPAELLAAFDRLTAERNYPSRSEALRDVMRNYLVASQWEDSDEEVVGTVTLVYDHEQRMLANQLTAAQHEHIDEVLSTLHIHLDRQNCLEVIVLRGAARDVQHLADHLMTARGVKHGTMVCTTTGSKLT